MVAINSSSAVDHPAPFLKKLKHLSEVDWDEKQIQYVITVNPRSPTITLEWLIELLQTSRASGGGSLLVTYITNYDLDDPEGYDRGRKAKHLEDVLLLVGSNFDDVKDPSKELSYSEKQKLVLRALEGMHVQEKGSLLGYPTVKLYPRQSVLQVCQREGIVGQYFAPHDDDQLEFLKKNWCFSTKHQPIDEIRNYFGDTIAFYFAFLGFYTKSLMVPSLVALSQLVFGSWINSLCAFVNIIWSVVFLKNWKRRSNELAHRWKTLGVLIYEEPRPGFKSKTIETDPLTGKPVPVYPLYKTWWKEYLVSLPLIFICLLLAFLVMLLYFQVDASLAAAYNQDPSYANLTLSYLPSVIYAILVSLMNKTYESLATRLNNWENHRTQSSHEAHWIIKLITFEYANNFMSIFYVGFYMSDIRLLQWQIGTLLVVNQIIDNLVEVCLPLWWTYKSNKRINSQEKKVDTDRRIAKIMRESQMSSYDDTYYDYLELYIQFGYVFLFASIFPYAPILALLNNLIEVRSDAIKLCYGHQRPHQRFASGINSAWMKAFETIIFVSVITNCALLSMSPLMNKINIAYNLSATQSLLFVVIVEHIIFAMVMVMNYLIPDTSKEVRNAVTMEHLKKRVSQPEI